MPNPKKGKRPLKKASSAGRKRNAKPTPRGQRPWLRFLALEVATWLGGVAVGLGVLSVVLWQRAQVDVAAFLATPSRSHPGVVYSAPMEVREGQAASVSDLAGELLAAGYERVPNAQAADQFSLAGGQFVIRTGRVLGPGFEVPEGEVVVQISEDGYVTSVDPGEHATLRPTVLGTVGDPETRRAAVRLEGLSPHVESAIVAMEDQRFRSHQGVDPIGVLRAALHNLSSDKTQGGSTLTQQLAKNLFLSPERTMQRKVREVFFALAIEHQLDKDQVLELYLQEVYLGQSGGVPLHGVEQAARAWFGVSAQTVDIAEAATIAGVISAPNTYSPVRHPERAIARRDRVIDRMLEMGFIDAVQARTAKDQALVVDGVLPGAHRRAPWAVDAAVEFAEEVVGEGALAAQGHRVYTTIQPLLQRAAERAVEEGLAEVEADYPKAAGAEAAIVALRASDGAIVALVGGRDYAQSPFDRATDAWRSVGSTVKPLTMLAAFDADSELTPLTRLWDSPLSRDVDGRAWTPTNYDGVYRGEVTLREAIESSLNMPAIRLSEQVGLGPLQATLRDLGLSRATRFPSVALGGFDGTPLEVAGAYTVFPGAGSVSEPYLVLGIADRNGGTVLETTPVRRAVASARAAVLSTAVLEGVLTDGTGARARRYGVEGPVAGKTGTTDNYRDAWFVGYSPILVASAWIGRDVGDDLGLSGSRAALPLWARFMAASGAIRGSFPASESVTTRKVCAESHRIARPDCASTYFEAFPAAHVPSDSCDLHGGPVVDVKHFLGGLLRRPAAAPDADESPSSTRRERREERARQDP
jgi:penicillin-binding protein 1B